MSSRREATRSSTNSAGGAGDGFRSYPNATSVPPLSDLISTMRLVHLMGSFSFVKRRAHEFKNYGRSEMSMQTSTILSPIQLEPEHYVCSEEAARFLKLNLRTIQRLAREGAIPAHPFGEGSRKSWRFLLSELDAWMKAKVNSPRRPCRSIGR